MKKKYFWKNLIVFISIISTLFLQGFSCYAASPEIGDASDSVPEVSLDSLDDSLDSSFSNDFSDGESAPDTSDTHIEFTNFDETDSNNDFNKEEIEISEIENENINKDEDVVEDEDAVTDEDSFDEESFEIEDAAGAAETIETENSADEKNTVSPIAVEEKIVAVDQPVISEYGVQPFDFIMDPQRLITETNGAKYGNISFEEGSTLYFRNMEGIYDYSGRSDRLTITNRSTGPVAITLTASLCNNDSISLTNDPTFHGDDRDSLYLALVDDKGNVIPLSESGEAKIIYELDGISRDAAAEEITGEQYSFGLMGACNANGAWECCDELPKVVVTWKVEPILTDENTISDNSISMNGGVSDNSVSMNGGVSDNSISMNGGVSDNSVSMNGGVSDNSISMNGGVSDNSVSMNGGVSDNSISMNGGVSDNSVSMNGGVSDNSISMNGGVSDNSVLMNGGVSDNSVSMNGGVSDNSVSMNGGISDNSVEVLDTETYMEDNEADSLDLIEIDEVLVGNISDNKDNNILDNNIDNNILNNNISDNNILDDLVDNEETETTEITEMSPALPEELTEDNNVSADLDDMESVTALAEDGSNNEDSDSTEMSVASGSSTLTTDDTGVAGSSLTSQAPTEAVSGLTDSNASIQTIPNVNVQVESGIYY